MPEGEYTVLHRMGRDNAGRGIYVRDWMGRNNAGRGIYGTAQEWDETMLEGQYTELVGTKQCRNGNIRDWTGLDGTTPEGEYTGLDWTKQCRKGIIRDSTGWDKTMPEGESTGLDWMGRNNTRRGIYGTGLDRTEQCEKGNVLD